MLEFEEFFLGSTEGPRRGQPWKCHLLGVAVWNEFNVLHVSVSPDISPGIYSGNRSKIALRELVLTPRFQGDSLSPISAWPMFVYIFTIKQDHFKQTGRIENQDLRLVDRGVVARTEDELRPWMYDES
jgi:hypothetical protein